MAPTPAEIDALAKNILQSNASAEMNSTDPNVKSNVKELREQLAGIKGFVLG
jgi:hypothetical protein